MLNLDFKIEKFNDVSDNGFFCSFNKAEVIEKKIDSKNLLRLFNILALQKDIDFVGDIYLNNLSFKKEKLVRNYLQKHSLFLDDFFIQKELSVVENIKLFSSLWNKSKLEDSVLSAFFLENVRNEKAKNLTLQQEMMLNLSKLVACPSYMWFINNKLLKNLDKDNMYIIRNIMNIRIKQGGICLILD